MISFIFIFFFILSFMYIQAWLMIEKMLKEAEEGQSPLPNDREFLSLVSEFIQLKRSQLEA